MKEADRNEKAKCHANQRTLASRKGCTGNLPSEFARPTTLIGRIKEESTKIAPVLVLLTLCTSKEYQHHHANKPALCAIEFSAAHIIQHDKVSYRRFPIAFV